MAADLPSADRTGATSPLARVWNAARRIERWWRSPPSAHSYFPEEEHKSKLRTVLDILYWQFRYGEFCEYYYMYGLDTRSSRLSSRMSETEFCAYRNLKNMFVPDQTQVSTPFNYLCLMRDKRLFFQLASIWDIPVPRNVAEVDRRQLVWDDGSKATPLEAIKTLDLDVICKPHDGTCGLGVFSLESDRGRFLIDGREAPSRAVVEALRDGYLLQEKVDQHEALARLHPESLNTIRLVTFCNDGAVQLGWAALRIGTGDNVTDNLATGGVFVRIDPDGGRLMADGFQQPRFGRRSTRHPDTGIVFEGFPLPYFDEAVAVVTRFHALVEGIHSIGWDVAITPEGPVVIEGNDDWGGELVMAIDPHFKENLMTLGRYPEKPAKLRKQLAKGYR